MVSNMKTVLSLVLDSIKQTWEVVMECSVMELVGVMIKIASRRIELEESACIS